MKGKKPQAKQAEKSPEKDKSPQKKDQSKSPKGKEGDKNKDKNKGGKAPLPKFEKKAASPEPKFKLDFIYRREKYTLKNLQENFLVSKMKKLIAKELNVDIKTLKFFYKEKEIKEINAGLYIFNNKALFEALHHVGTNNAAGEYYLTDVLGIFVKWGLKAGSYVVSDRNETLGVNDRAQLAVAAKLIQQRINKKLMLSGVTIEDPDNTYIGPSVKIDADTIIKPGCYIMGNTVIGSECVIGPNVVLEDAIVPEGKIVK